MNDKEIKWHRWEYITIRGDDKEKRIISCVQKTTPVDEFLKSYENDMHSYTPHIFRANWQHGQMSECISKLKHGQVMVVMDFAENYKCGSQNEVQSAYFDQNMVTIHPMMYYYKKENKDHEEILVKYAVIGISDDLKHDGHAVSIFEKKSQKISFQNNHRLMNISNGVMVVQPNIKANSVSTKFLNKQLIQPATILRPATERMYATGQGPLSNAYVIEPCYQEKF